MTMTWSYITRSTLVSYMYMLYIYTLRPHTQVSPSELRNLVRCKRTMHWSQTSCLGSTSLFLSKKWQILTVSSLRNASVPCSYQVYALKLASCHFKASDISYIHCFASCSRLVCNERLTKWRDSYVNADLLDKPFCCIWNLDILFAVNLCSPFFHTLNVPYCNTLQLFILD